MATLRTCLRSSVLAFALVLGGCVSSPGQDGDSARIPRADDGYEIDGRQVPSTRTLYSMARIFATQKKDAECEAVLIRIVADHPSFLPVYTDLAELYLRHDRVDSAIEVLRTGVKQAPEDAVLNNDLGMCYLLQNRYEEALESFTAAATGIPHDARARGNMAVALGLMGRLDEALSVWMQLVPPADAHHNLGVVCRARRENARAEREFEIAEALRSGRKQAAPAAAPATSPP